MKELILLFGFDKAIEINKINIVCKLAEQGLIDKEKAKDIALESYEKAFGKII